MKKIEIYQDKIDDNHVDSFWYDGAIASKGKYTVYACGEIRVATDFESDWMNGYEALEYADENNMTDKDLVNLEWGMNNWFEIVDDENNSVDVFHDYNEVIEALKNID
jgi:hypothetical protein